MAETFVQLPDDSLNTGKKEDHFQIPNGNVREAVILGSPTANAEVAEVTAAWGAQVDPRTLPRASTSVLSNVTAADTNTTVLAANASRMAFMMVNDSDKNVWVKCGATASATSFTKKLLPQDTFRTQDLGVNYTGKIDAIWDTSPTGAMRVTEMAA